MKDYFVAILFRVSVLFRQRLKKRHFNKCLNKIMIWAMYLTGRIAQWNEGTASLMVWREYICPRFKKKQRLKELKTSDQENK